MAFQSYSKSRRAIDRTGGNSIFSQLIKASVDRIHALELFFYVGPQVREKETLRTPACILVPRIIDIAEQNLTGKRFDYRYVMDVGFALKEPDDCIILQQALWFSEQIKKAFSYGDDGANILTFTLDIEGYEAVHYNTIVTSVPIEVLSLIANNVLAFSSGLQVEFSVWVDY